MCYHVATAGIFFMKGSQIAMPSKHIAKTALAGDGHTDDTLAMQAAIDKHAGSGQTLRLHPGVYSCGSLRIPSHCHLHLEHGATLKARPDLGLYPHYPSRLESRMDRGGWRAFLYAADAQDIALTGQGAIDGSGSETVFQNGKNNSPDRPYGIHFVQCRHIRVQDLTLRDSAFWMQRYYDCEDVRLTHLSVFNHVNKNNDGLDIDGSRRVFVDHCLIDTSDDAACIKAEGPAAAEDILITNCILSSHASAIKLGTGSVGGFRRIQIRGCTIRPSLSTHMAHPYSCWEGLVGIDLATVDGGALEDILVDGVLINGVETPLFIRQGNRFGKPMWPDMPEHLRNPHTRAVVVRNVRATNTGPIACSVTGYPERPIEDVYLENLDLHQSRPPSPDALEQPIQDLTNRYPLNRMFQTNLPAYGFFLRNIRDITLRNVRLRPAQHDPRPPFHADHVKRLCLESCRATVPAGREPLTCGEGMGSIIERNNFWESETI